MLSRMAPSSPPDMRTLHLLRTPDILCANDIRPPVSNFVAIPLKTARFDSIWDRTGGWHSITPGWPSLGAHLFPITPVSGTAKPADCGGVESGTCEGGFRRVFGRGLESPTGSADTDAQLL